MEKFLENLQEAEKIIRQTDHMLYITFPLVKDKRLLIKILLETKNAIAKLINIILRYEYFFKRIRLYSDQKTNFRTFKEKSAREYEITEYEIALISELFKIAEVCKTSPIEFLKGEKIVILSEKMAPTIVTFEETKEFLSVAKSVLKKAKNVIQR